MSYVVLARKYRPQSFEDLVGQGHVSTTLENAIAKNRVAHAFLFTGVRGVGKTTSARILAKSLNCVKGPTSKPCQECPPCKEITVGSDVDVQEIDGASYTGVDDVRKLQESLPYRPSRDRFKIFIVDEVHMLSNNAWNAFLKTLEEPPPHVKFIFATTEVHKIPVTILSRCQRYDFKLISALSITSRLRFVLDREGVAYEDAALSIIAREAAGSMRDAMSLLDQVLAWVGVDGDKLTAEGVARVLGVADRSVLHGLAAALVDGDAEACLRTVSDLAHQGYDLPHVARDFLAHLRDLVVAKVSADPTGLLDLADSELADVKALAARAEADDLTRLHQGFSRSFDDVTRSGQPRAALEMTLVRLARRPPLMPVDDLLRRIGEMERRLLGGGGGGGAPSGSVGHGRPMQGGGTPPGQRRGASADPSPGPSAANVAPTTFSAPPAPANGVAHGPSTSSPPSNGVAHGRPPYAPPTNGAAHGAATFSAPTNGAPHGRPSFAPPTNGAAARPSTVPPPAEGVSRGPSAPNPADLAAFRAVIELVRAKRAPLASVLEHAALVRIGPDGIVLGFEANSFLGKQAQEPVAIEAIRAALAAHYGGKPDVTFEALRPQSGAVTLAQIEGAGLRARLDNARRAIADHPLVTAAIELLGAELRDVRLGQEDAAAAERMSTR
ncbi:DNA polymerase III subunit gamma/tau [Polyangium jinanense]|uniref:DNA polymerase III subunit gamma/tau n=1 Tax=Polyangium jinanense TaxID=2829994 RepID=A0A9X4ARV2_9BACT|nr:DNA polymerase III subunit gamma/tau [Polyangium jinanense]MDC3952939.1 DNA polymerase III subunit gamma/tau [Polyangium jinanense]MDC3980557.1 DNA polymerase III subunit gamma/tau [Polyangium jinanense]